MSLNVESGEQNEMREQMESPILFTALNFINMVSALLLGGVAMAALTFANLYHELRISRVSDSFSTHIYLCVIGYVVIMAPSVHILCSSTSWARALTYPNRKVIHLILQVIGSAMALIGGIIRISDRGFFNTAHGTFGFVAMVLTTLTLIGGVVNLLGTSLIIKICHLVLGILTICVAFTTMCIAFHEYYRDVYGDSSATLLMACTIIGLCGTVSLPCVNIIRKLASL